MSQRNGDRWGPIVDSAILNCLGEQGEADLEGLLHVLRRARIRIQPDELREALSRLSGEGRVAIDLDPSTGGPVVRLQRPFVGWL